MILVDHFSEEPECRGGTACPELDSGRHVQPVPTLGYGGVGLPTGVGGAPCQGIWRGGLHDWRVVLFFGCLSALAKTYSFAIVGYSIGLSELQMCMALTFGSFLNHFNYFLKFFFIRFV